MPNYGKVKRKWSQKRGRWETQQTQSAFDYDSILKRKKEWGLLISFFRFFPDYFLDLIRDKNAPYGLELPQRLMLRIQAQYQTTYITGARGITKTFVNIGGKAIDGVLYPGDTTRYYAPSQKQSAKLASQAFASFEKCYPILAKWWNKNNDRSDMFRLTTFYGSEFTMYAPRGDNFHSVIGEEMTQEGEECFDFDSFESEVKKGHRLTRNVNGKKDRTRIQLKFNCISNASSRQNRGFTVYRDNALKLMLYGDKYDGFCMDISWKSALLCNLRDIAYYKKEKSTTPAETWQREMEVRYTGTGDNPMLSDEILASSKKVMVIETKHCGKEDCYYVVAHDVSYEEGQKNAKCADVVWKCTRYTIATKRDKYKKQAVWVDSYKPPATEALQAQKLKDLWLRFCKDGANPTYIVVDARAVGKTVVQELMKPTNDGTPALCCYEHCAYADIEQPHALPVVYPLKATRAGGKDDEGQMIRYLQREWEQGNIEIPTTNVLDGVEAYKRFHGIKDTYQDGKIAQVYKQAEGWCEEIQNLQVKVSGTSIKEERKSKAKQRDRHSAAKYGLWFISIALEDKLVKETYKAKSSWSTAIESYNNGTYSQPQKGTTRANLLALRKR